MAKITNYIYTIVGTITVAFLSACLCSCTGCFSYAADQECENHIEVLKQSGPYRHDTERFNIHSVANPKRAAVIREYFQLDTLYDDSASTWEKTLAMAKFVATNIPHANQTVQPKRKNAIYLWEYSKNTEPAFNCRLHSIMLFELLTAAGIDATYITCMPRNCHDSDCHVVNQVWLPEQGKWAMIDSDMGGCYATDSVGNLLSLQEMREYYIHDTPIFYHPQFGDSADKEFWYYDYMAKNTYWFSCWESIHFDQEPAEGKDAGRYIHLVPEGFKPFGVNRGDIVTNDDRQFWAAPGKRNLKGS